MFMKNVIVVTTLLVLSWSDFTCSSFMKTHSQWAELKFNFPSEQAKQRAVAKRHYVPGNSIPIDVDVYYNKRIRKIFVTIPRFDEGRPMTLATLDEDKTTLTAYPDYSWHDNQGENCDGFTSVFRVAIDECYRLWVLDTGKIGDTKKCSPQLLAFNLINDTLIYRHRITVDISDSLFVTPVVDVTGECSEDTYVYIADVTGFGLVVVDMARDRSWRISHRLFFPYPNRGNFTIAGESFDLMDGVLGLALSPKGSGDNRELYFHALASTTENVVSTSVLQNERFINDSNADPDSITLMRGQRTSQSAAQAMDKNGILYFGLMDPPSIWCWNVATEFKPKNFQPLYINETTLQFASGVKVVINKRGEEELWVLTSRFQKVMTGSINSKEINFRILAATISEGLDCKSSRGRTQSYYSKYITPFSSKGLTFKYGAVSYL